MTIAAAVGARRDRQAGNRGDRDWAAEGFDTVAIGGFDRGSRSGNDEELHLAQEPIGLVPIGNLVQQIGADDEGELCLGPELLGGGEGVEAAGVAKGRMKLEWAGPIAVGTILGGRASFHELTIVDAAILERTILKLAIIDEALQHPMPIGKSSTMVFKGVV